VIRHIVMWTLKEKDLKLKLEHAKEMKRIIENLNGKIDGLISAEVGFNFNLADGYDVCLLSSLESKEALAYYQNHPLHVEVKKFVSGIVSQRAVSDYEI